MKKALSTALRLSMTGATVAGIGWAFLTLNPPSPQAPADQAHSLVKESQADIFGMSFAAPNKTQRFVEALDRLGHEPPRAYEANGNAMFFSTAVTHKMPEEVLREYQQEFVNQGLNSEVYTQSPFDLLSAGKESTYERAMKIIDASMRGEMIPHAVSRNHVALGGATMNLPEQEFEGRPDALLANKAELTQSAVERYLAAYEQCGGDASIYQAQLDRLRGVDALVAQAKAGAQPDSSAGAQDAQGAQGAPADIKGASALIDKAAQADGACSGGAQGGMCSQERAQLDQASTRATALERAIEAQPELQACPALVSLNRVMASASFKDARQRIKSMRYVEAIRDEHSQTTSVTATWSAEDMDAKKFMTETFGYPKEQTRGDFPLCPGCRRSWNFGGTGKERDYVTDIVFSTDSVGRVSDYYIREMAQQGWRLADSSAKAQELMQADGVQTPTRHLRFQRGDKFMAVRIGYNEHHRQTEVIANTSD